MKRARLDARKHGISEKQIGVYFKLNADLFEINADLFCAS
jgi:hypothetical protein